MKMVMLLLKMAPCEQVDQQNDQCEDQPCCWHRPDEENNDENDDFYDYADVC